MFRTFFFSLIYLSLRNLWIIYGFFFSSEAMILFPCTNMPPCFSLLLHLLFLLTLGLLYVTSHQGKPIAINHEGEVSCHYAISTLKLDRRIMISKIQQNEHYPQCTKFVMITPPWGVGGVCRKSQISVSLGIIALFLIMVLSFQK